MKGKKAIIFAIPGRDANLSEEYVSNPFLLGPFTPTCSETHVPGYLNAYEALKAKGVNEVICISVVDGFIMNAFAKAYKAGNKVIMVGDGSAEFSKALGLTQDLTKAGMGIRSKRFAIIVDDLVVKYVGVEEGPGVNASGVDAVLAKL